MAEEPAVVVTCLLCSGLLPAGEEGVVEQHMREQHRVFANMPLMVGATRLEGIKLELVAQMVADLGREMPKAGDETKGESMDNLNKYYIYNDEDMVKCELESNSESDKEEEYKPEKVKRPYKKSTKKTPHEKMGKIDKVIRSTGFQPEMGPCVCPICRKDFVTTDAISEKAYRRHVYSHRVGKWNCDCGVVHETHKHNHPKKFHIYTVHRGSLHCSTCHQTFRDESLYKEHIEKHGAGNGSTECICDDCGFTAKNKYLLSNHKAYKHDHTVTTCELCGDQFQGRLKMMVHKRRSHTNAGPKQCPHCGGTYSQIWKHMREMHTEEKDKKYHCEYCQRGFMERHKMEAHIRSAHTGEKPFACRYMCGQACAEAGNRKKHEVSR
jgi:hypothetical protein